MSDAPAQPIGDHGPAPADVLARWPRGLGLAAVWGERPGGWTVLAPPAGMRVARDAAGAMTPLDAPASGAPAADGHPPFLGGWIGWLGYDLGRELEPAAGIGLGAADDRGWPLAVWARCPGAYVHEHDTGRWWAVGDAGVLPAWDGLASELGGGPAPAFGIAARRSVLGREAFEDRVLRALAYIRAGDVYQVNLTHRLEAGFSGSRRGLFGAMVRAARPWHGAYVEWGEGGNRRAVCSVSPELFLDAGVRPGDGSVRVRTRPMKGTRPASGDADELDASEKDRAELNMIVDLMRNDLGRVCRFGSIRVDTPRRIERHAESVLQATATISGTLRPGIGLGGLVRASFPPGSVTGAPKIRAMQIIDGLEPVRRGPYCGSAGWVSDGGGASLSVAIRTAAVSVPEGGEGTLDFGVGAGIVADSDPGREWLETLDKAEILERVARGAAREGAIR